MGKVENIEQQIQALSPEELAWDRQIERDVRAGRLDGLAEKALRDHAAGKPTLL